MSKRLNFRFNQTSPTDSWEIVGLLGVYSKSKIVAITSGRHLFLELPYSRSYAILIKNGGNNVVNTMTRISAV